VIWGFGDLFSLRLKSVFQEERTKTQALAQQITKSPDPQIPK